MVGVAGFEPTASWSRIGIVAIKHNTFKRKSLDIPASEGVFCCLILIEISHFCSHLATYSFKHYLLRTNKTSPIFSQNYTPYNRNCTGLFHSEYSFENIGICFVESEQTFEESNYLIKESCF